MKETFDIKHNDKDYVLDVDKAVELGVLKEKKDPIVWVKTGDVFKGPKGNIIILVSVAHTDGGKKYQLSGFDNSLYAYNNRDKNGMYWNALTSEQVVEYLNQEGWVCIGNVNYAIELEVKKLLLLK